MTQAAGLAFLVNRKTGSRHRINDVKLGKESSDLPKFSTVRRYTTQELPPSVDLREFMTPVEDQEQMGSCVANALAGAYEFLVKKNSGQHIDFSRLFIYYNARIQDGEQEDDLEDQGTYITSAIEALKKIGCCKEELHPYREAYINHKPPQPCYLEAAKYRISEGMQLKIDLEEMKACLAQGYPFAFGLKIFESFAKAEENNRGRVPMPTDRDKSSDEEPGWHAMLAVGYSDLSECFIVRNSWGATWVSTIHRLLKF
ncbi:unnamed protein product [Adineta steineri]|uniref:Peptidase C1A papain C-terminal domain-containing protein n=1 Tax=Adineta steineri TaxID=433720 RepID=A0A814VHW2_9BILA|nr:unnamed protein product [Adineta steineri]CAF3810834.1 unnamed protein product [Adineta steineri]